MNDSKVTPVEAQAVPDLPVAWYAFKHNQGNGKVGWTFHSPQEYATAYRDTCLEIIPLFTRPTPAAAAPLTDERLMELFATVESPRDAALLRMDAEGKPVEAVEAIGARHNWHAFLRIARAVERAASPAAAAGVPTNDAIQRAIVAFDMVLSYPEFDCDNKAEPRPLCAFAAEAQRGLIALASPVAPVGAPTEERTDDAAGGARELPNVYDGDWWCADHLEQPMGHDGCTSEGVPEGARLHIALNRARLLEQEVREAGYMRDEMAAAARRLASSDAKDAARYRWLRDHSSLCAPNFGAGVGLLMNGKDAKDREKLDRHIDASMAYCGSKGQGCELATDATKQREREHSVHLAVNDAEEDFRRRPASSEACAKWLCSGAG